MHDQFEHAISEITVYSWIQILFWKPVYDLKICIYTILYAKIHWRKKAHNIVEKLLSTISTNT